MDLRYKIVANRTTASQNARAYTRGYKPVALCENFTPFLPYIVKKVKAGTYWIPDDWEGYVKYTGHFAKLPKDYVIVKGFVFDAEKTLHCCTVGAKDPRDINNYTEESDSEILVSPEYEVAVHKSDIKMMLRITDKKPKHSRKWSTPLDEKTFLSWCLSEGIEPECKYVEGERTMWNLEYPQAEMDDKTLATLRLVKVDGEYWNIKEDFGSGFKSLPKNHPLSTFVGVDYKRMKELVSQDISHKIVNLRERWGIYCLNAGIAKYDGKEFKYSLLSGYKSEGDITIRYSDEVLRAVLKVRQGETLAFDGDGDLRINDSEVAYLHLQTSVMAMSGCKDVVLLGADCQTSRYQPATRSLQMRYQNLIVYTAYRTDGTAKQLKVYDTQQRLEVREKKSDRVRRLGVEPYLAEIDISKWNDPALSDYAKYRKGVDNGEYVLFTKESEEIAEVLQYTHRRKNDFKGLNWIGSALDRGDEIKWDTLAHNLRIAGIGDCVCGKLFVRKDCVAFADALQHCFEMKSGRIRDFLTGIVNAFHTIGLDKMQRLGLQQI